MPYLLEIFLSCVNRSEKHFLSIVLFIQFDFSWHSAVSKLKCTVVKRHKPWFLMQIRFFLSRNRFSRKSHWPWNISFPEAPVRFFWSGRRNSTVRCSRFANFRNLRNIPCSWEQRNSDRGTVGFLYDFFLLSSLYYLFNGRIISCGWKNPSCKNLKTFNNSVLMARISSPFHGLSITTLHLFVSFLYLW